MSSKSEYKSSGTDSEQEKELTNILIDSSLYQELYPEEKKKLLSHLVSSYYNEDAQKQSGPSRSHSVWAGAISRFAIIIVNGK